ncbi:MAG: cellulase family glycosylhydrolase [Jatrophihabitantaceae bacterium]
MRIGFRGARATAVLAAVVLTAGLLATVNSESSAASAGAPASVGPTLPLGQVGTWQTDATGRVVVLHGLNQVFKTAPYEPSAAGFGDDDAAFLQANGFNAVRLGVIWAAVEPQPGVYDDSYLNSIADTVHTLAAHGIVSLLDFHQDLYNEKFQGEGAPAWAVIDGGLPNPANGFPFNYFTNLALDQAWDSFWRNAKASDGIGLQDHYAAAWKHVAQRFAADPDVLGYEVMNEPWPGTLWEPCAIPLLGCALFDKTLTAFYQRVANAIRTVDTHKTVWIEPNVLMATVDANNLGKVNDPAIGFTFHVYCPTEAELQTNLLCTPLDDITIATARRYPTKYQVPWLLTEFGATQDLANIAGDVAKAVKNMLGWTEWAYTGNDKTSASPAGQALVLDPSLPPTGSNVLTAKLKVLAEAYPQVVAGTPSSWSSKSGVFKFVYSTTRADRSGRFAAGSVTDIAAPAIAFPNGYHVTVVGGTVVSAPNATTLQIASNPGAIAISVTVS